MSQIQELKSVPLAKGCIMRIYIDHAQARDSPLRRWTEVIYDGKPSSQVFEVPPHWHKDHDEVMQVTIGAIDMTIEGITTRVHAGDPPILIPRGRRHSLICVPGIRSVLREHTDPVGEFKEWFFRDFFRFGASPPFLYAMRAFWDGDCYPVIPVGGKMVDQAFLGIFGALAKLVVPAKKPLEKEPWPETDKEMEVVRAQAAMAA